MSAHIEDRNISLGLARSVAPFETGNLRFNAIQAFDTSRGFRIQYSLADAYYIYFLEEGTRYSSKHKGFIENRTVPLIAQYLFAKHSSKNLNDVDYFEREAQWGNTDFLKKHQFDFRRSFFNSITPYEMIQQREWRHLDSALANAEVYGHMSNVYNWKNE